MSPPDDSRQDETKTGTPAPAPPASVSAGPALATRDNPPVPSRQSLAREAGAAAARPRPARRPAVPAGPVLQRRATAALFLALLSLFGLMAIDNLTRGVYVAGFALLAGLAAIWFAATSITRTRRQGTARPRASVTATVIAGIGVLISAVLIAGFAMLGQQLSAYSQCLSGANTIMARQSCQHQFSSAVSNRLTGARAAGR